MSDKKDSWTAIRDLFDQIIYPATGWQDATIVASPEEMRAHFHEAFPDVMIWGEDMRMALHDLNIPFERNEHNNKYYYLAKWK